MESDLVDDIVDFVEKVVEQTSESPSDMYGLVKKHVVNFNAELDRMRKGIPEETKEAEPDIEKPPEDSHAETARMKEPGPELTGNNLLDSLILKEVLAPPLAMRKGKKAKTENNADK